MSCRFSSSPVNPTFRPAGLDAALKAAATRRMEAKCRRTEELVAATRGDWETAFFAMLARAMGFGRRSEIFMRWALTLDLRAAAKHRDDPTQTEAFFLGTAGLLDTDETPGTETENAGFNGKNGEKLTGRKFELTPCKFKNTGCKSTVTGHSAADNANQQSPTAGCHIPEDGYPATLRREFAFLRHKFSLRTMDGRLWKTGGYRPQNAAPLRLAQLAAIFRNGLTLSEMFETPDLNMMHRRLRVPPADFWRTHYTVDTPATPHSTTLSAAAADLIIINAVAPLICAYGRAAGKAGATERALALWTTVGAERNRITAKWAARGLKAASALETQALLQIESEYCRGNRCTDCPMRTWCPEHS